MKENKYIINSKKNIAFKEKIQTNENKIISKYYLQKASMDTLLKCQKMI